MSHSSFFQIRELASVLCTMRPILSLWRVAGWLAAWSCMLACLGCDTLREPADAGFHPGDCTHPDWPGLHICCGRSGEMPGSNCERPELVDHPCSTEGQTQDLKAFRVCCKGLTPISTATSNDITTTDAGSCNVEFELDPTRICAQCGDGRCGVGENSCNCASDCGPAPTR
jgi:hypothetical protein